MASLFSNSGEGLDQGYLNLKAQKHRVEQLIVAALEEMWARFEPYADPNFVSAFAMHPEPRFWEMYVGCLLIDSGLPVVRRADRSAEGPDFLIEEAGTRIWLEAIAPEIGNDPDDAIPPLVPISSGGGAQRVPHRELSLRIASALWTKNLAFGAYVDSGLVASGDIKIIAIGGAHFGHLPEMDLPHALRVVFPIGDQYVTLDRETFKVVGNGYHQSDEIGREKGAIPRTAFLDQQFSHISGLLWSRASIGNYEREYRPVSLVHNPTTDVPVRRGYIPCDKEFVAAEDGDIWTVDDIRAQ